MGSSYKLNQFAKLLFFNLFCPTTGYVNYLVAIALLIHILVRTETSGFDGAPLDDVLKYKRASHFTDDALSMSSQFTKHILVQRTNVIEALPSG